MTTTTEPAAPTAGQECPRCAHHLRPDWNFCPTCSLPAGPGKEVLSSQIRVLRPTAATPPVDSPLLRWVSAAAALALVGATTAVGFVLLSPEGGRMLLPDPPAGSPETGTVLPAAGQGIGLEWVTVPAGPFRYGSPQGGRNYTEEVEIPAFQIARYEVTNTQWMEYLLERREDLQALDRWAPAVPSYFTWRKDPAGKDDLPVIPPGEESLPVRGVSFEQAEAFCAWLDVSGRAPGARLPREDEWEKAARGTDGRVYPWGDDFMLSIPVPGKTLRLEGGVVAAPLPTVVTLTVTDLSPYGVYHMGGNVSEWTDLWGRRPEEARGPWDRYQVIRGASFQDGLEDGAIYARTWNNDVRMEVGMSALWVGFRVARDAPPERGR